MDIKNDDSIVIIGGYGLVGSEIARLIHVYHPEITIGIAGRSAEKASSLLKELGNAHFIQMDVNEPESLNHLPSRPSALVCAVNDTHDYILKKAVSDGIPLVDITRWNEPLLRAIESLKSVQLKSPILFSSAWMSGISAIMARHVINELENPVLVDIDILYSMNDKSGPNAIEFMDQFHKSFAVIEDASLKWIKPLRNSHITNFPGSRRYRTYRFGTPEQYTLPLLTGIRKAVTRISFDSGWVTRLLAFVVQSGLWKLISGKRFDIVRKSILYNPGDGAAAVVMVEAQGGDGLKKTVTAIDPLGQSHLTAVGALIQIERILGLDKAHPPEGITFPEESPVIDRAMGKMIACGVKLYGWLPGGLDAKRG